MNLVSITAINIMSAEINDPHKVTGEVSIDVAWSEERRPMDTLSSDVLLAIVHKLAAQDPLALLTATCACKDFLSVTEDNSWVWKKIFYSSRPPSQPARGFRAFPPRPRARPRTLPSEARSERAAATAAAREEQVPDSQARARLIRGGKCWADSRAAAMDTIPNDVLLTIVHKLAAQDPLALLTATCARVTDENEEVWRNIFYGSDVDINFGENSADWRGETES
ncbi:hypothetical protein KFL_001110145 [Klebsormidium nitens]|uniref:F-box domain-containing protein n=1 Tax=Klebsormidium nitens TaxID=105231 RepID=A0A1Y1I2T5_KLENI|nr:hypothetical protein KFL_001110145 [Klebsormidium nitens]|eukprot:GAQ82438.1 hypothetical protein KFL_001110145 [Klebsormidium nitens]